MQRTFSTTTRRLVWLLAVVALLAAVPGCGGCRKEVDPEEQAKKEAEERAKKEKAKPKEPFEVPLVSVRPWDTQHPRNYCKPGHWTSFLIAGAKANNADFLGELEMFAANKKGDPAPLAATPHDMVCLRPAVLPKGQAKSFESLLWVPPSPEGTGLSYRLTGPGGGFGNMMALPPMPSYQYLFVVLARSPLRYDYLDKQLDAIKPRGVPEASITEASPPHYVVVRNLPGKRPDLPSHALFWTSIAYVLWDDLDPGDLEAEQQQALLDWLHWGGQLIVSGPNTLDTLRNSFLAPYLPATATGTRELKAADLADLTHWAGRAPYSSRSARGKHLAEREEYGSYPSADPKPLVPVRPWVGVQLKLHPHARPIDHTGDMLVERALGRGRVVVSAFPLSVLKTTAWPGWDNLFNACLLRRPGRTFRDDGGKLMVSWADEKQHPNPLDAALTSKVRYFARDAGVRFADYGGDVVSDSSYSGETKINEGTISGEELPDGVKKVDTPPLSGPGLAAWNDFSPVAQAARQTLTEAAGIRVPNRSFIVWVVVVYLLVLVPANWLLFRLLGRVEWAWAAAPVVAIGCTLLVIHLAQLNVGFARSQNEIAVVELQADYPRAHVTRYTALYTSLATGYQLQCDDPGGLVLPFPLVEKPSDFRMLTWQGYQRLTCRRGDDTRVSGFSVNSNSIGFVHSEHLADMGGAVSLTTGDDGRRQIVNRTRLTLRGTRVIMKVGGGGMEAAPVGTLPPGTTAALNFRGAGGPPATERGTTTGVPEADETSVQRAAGGPPAPRQAGETPAPQEPDTPSGELGLRRLIEIAERGDDLLPGQGRLVASAEDNLPGMTVTPTAPQSRRITLVVAQLGDALAVPPDRDVNLRTDLIQLRDPGHPKIDDNL